MSTGMVLEVIGSAGRAARAVCPDCGWRSATGFLRNPEHVARLERFEADHICQEES